MLKKIIISIASIVIGLIMISCGISGYSEKNNAPDAVYETTFTPPKPTSALTVFEDGGYQVGVQIKAGKYRPINPVDDSIWCSWTIFRNDTQEDIVDIGFADTGRPRITVKSGQYLEVSGCGTWGLYK